jgi:hypothetical protein
MNISALLKELTRHQEQLENGNLHLEDLNQLVQLSQELLERYTILRYKAYEGNEIPEATASPAIDEEIMEEPTLVHEIEAPEELEEEEIDIELEKEEPVAFDFSLFDDTSNDVQETELEEDAVEHVSISAITEEDEGITEQIITMEQVIQTPTADENKAFIKQFSTIESGFFNQIGMSRLDSLIGSFGLNERLQYINELFNGSSEAFSDAVKRLDNLGSYQDALIEASKFAHEYNWDLESETVEELVIKLKRRHG